MYGNRKYSTQHRLMPWLKNLAVVEYRKAPQASRSWKRQRNPSSSWASRRNSKIQAFKSSETHFRFLTTWPIYITPLYYFKPLNFQYFTISAPTNTHNILKFQGFGRWEDNEEIWMTTDKCWLNKTPREPHQQAWSFWQSCHIKGSSLKDSY